MTAVVLALILVLVLFVGAVVWGGRPYKHRHLTPERVLWLIRGLLQRGYHGGALFIEAPKDGRFLQLLKYAGRGATGVQLDFPLAPWSEPYIWARRITGADRLVYEVNDVASNFLQARCAITDPACRGAMPLRHRDRAPAGSRATSPGVPRPRARSAAGSSPWAR